MAFNPLPLAIVVICTLGFETALYGSDVVTNGTVHLLPVDFATCGGAGLDTIACWVGNAGAVLLDFFLMLGNIVIVMFNVTTFNLPDAPGTVRVIVVLLNSLAATWSFATLVRGN